MAGDIVRETIVQFGAICGALLAIVAFLTVLGRTRPVRWFFRVNVSQPLQSWAAATIDSSPALGEIRTNIETITGELRTNDGSSLKDAVRRMEDRANAIEGMMVNGQPPTP